MRTALLIAEGELVDHLPRGTSGRIEISFDLPAGVRDLVQSTGIPHIEVGRMEIDGEAGRWEARVDDGAAIRLWPRYPLEDPPDGVAFLLDVHLGKLARHLRLLGIDASHDVDADDDDLAWRSVAEHRALLTRDRGLLMRSSLEQGRWIRSVDPEQQAAEVVRSFRLGTIVHLFGRCLACNGTLEPADAGSVEVPEGVRLRHDSFQRCLRCRRVYWAGSHTVRMRATADRILGLVDQRE